MMAGQALFKEDCNTSPQQIATASLAELVAECVRRRWHSVANMKLRQRCKHQLSLGNAACRGTKTVVSARSSHLFPSRFKGAGMVQQGGSIRTFVEQPTGSCVIPCATCASKQVRQESGVIAWCQSRHCLRILSLHLALKVCYSYGSMRDDYAVFHCGFLPAPSPSGG